MIVPGLLSPVKMPLWVRSPMKSESRSICDGQWEYADAKTVRRLLKGGLCTIPGNSAERHWAVEKARLRGESIRPLKIHGEECKRLKTISPTFFDSLSRLPVKTSDVKVLNVALPQAPAFVRWRPIGSKGVQLASKKGLILEYFQRLSRIKAIESSGFMERAMGIEPITHGSHTAKAASPLEFTRAMTSLFRTAFR